MATVNKETLIKKEIRRLIREAINWWRQDDGCPTFYSSENYHYAKEMKGLTLSKKEKDYVYYTRSSRAIEEIAEKIYKLVKESSKCRRK